MAFNQFPLPQPYSNPCDAHQHADCRPSGNEAHDGESNNSLVMRRGVVLQGPGGIPAHPHVLPMRHSREYAGSSPTAMDLPSYRNNLLSTLNSERWGHHRAVQNMEQELAFHREEIGNLQRGCESWAQAWTACNDELLRSEADRIRLLQDIVQLRAEMNLLEEAHGDLLQQVKHALIS